MVEEGELSRLLSLHLELHGLVAACSLSVRSCATYYSHHSDPNLGQELSLSPQTCSTLLQSLHTTTLSMYGQ